MILEPHVIGTYKLLIQGKKRINWKDILTASENSLPDDGIPYDAQIYNAATELASALEKLDAHAYSKFFR